MREWYILKLTLVLARQKHCYYYHKDLAMFPKTLFFYFIRLYTARFGLVLSIVSAGLLISNVFDILSRYRSTKFTIGIFLNLASFKIPYLLVEVLPIISFITTIIFFEYLVRSRELVSVFNTGASMWKVLSSIFISLFFIGIITTSLIQPMSSMLLASYDRIEAKVLKKKTDSIIISESGVMIAEDYESEKRFIVTKIVDVKNNKLSDITILITDQDNRFINRIEAEYAIIVDSNITLYNAKNFSAVVPEFMEEFTIPTNLTINVFVENLVNAGAISFWDFSSKITRLKDAGVPFIKYQLYYYKTLFKSVTIIAFMFLAVCFVSRTEDRVRGLKKPFIAIIISFAIYLLNEICVSIFIHNGLDPMLAILCPMLLIIFFSVFTILHLHEAG